MGAYGGVNVSTDLVKKRFCVCYRHTISSFRAPRYGKLRTFCHGFLPETVLQWSVQNSVSVRLLVA